jgi:hypothetical protein
MSFNNLLLALALTVLWPLVLMGLLAGAEWVERRTLNGGEVAPRGLRPALSAPPEPAQGGMAGVAEADAGVPAAPWSAAGRGAPGGSPDGGPGRGPFGGGGGDAAEHERVVARRALGGGRHVRRAGGGRHERRG